MSRLFSLFIATVAATFCGKVARSCREEIVSREVDCFENVAGRVVGFKAFFLREGKIIGWHKDLYLSCKLDD